jgi:hypothetical protein
MDKAYDSILCCVVDARSLAKTVFYKESDYFRYKCLCCGEEVSLAAVNSTIQTPHFRHKKGNNDTKCEAYLGQIGAIEKYLSVRNRSRDHVSFFFNTDRNTFEFAFVLQSEELAELKSRQAVLEVKKKYFEDAFLSIPINNTSFVANEPQYFTINVYSGTYYVYIPGNVYVLNHPIEAKNKLQFFKSRLYDNRAKKVSSTHLYTDTRYVVISEDKACINKLISFTNVECLTKVNEFITMGKHLFSVAIIFSRAHFDLNLFLHNYQFHIETSETLSVLWPPLFMKNSDYICESEKVFVRSSFPLVPNGNTNALCIMGDISLGITQLKVENKTIIKEKNVDLVLIKSEIQQIEVLDDKVQLLMQSNWEVTGDMDYFLLDKEGYRKLIIGEKVYLLEDDRILGYKNNHLKCIVSSDSNSMPTAEIIIADILKYHPQSEIYNHNDFSDGLFSKTVSNYLEACSKNGRINTIVKKYIKEGLL